MRKDTLYLTLSRDITSYTITSGQRAIATNVNYAVTIESPTLTTNLAGRDVSLIISDTEGNTLTTATTFYPDTKNPYKAVTGSLLLDGGVYGKFFDNKPVDTAVRLPIVIRDKSATLLSSDIVVVNGGEVAEPSASDEVVAGLVNAIRFYDLAEFKAWLDGTKERPDGLKPTDIVVGQWVHTQQDGSFVCKELIGSEPSVTKNFTTIVTQFPLTGTLKMNPDNGVGLSVYSGDVYNDADATSYSVDAITYKGDAFTFTAGDNQIARQKDNYALENRVNSTMTATLNAVKADNASTYQAMLPVMNTTVEARDRAETAAQGAKSSETRAVEAETNAATSEANALAYKNSASASEENAGLYRQQALTYSQKAEQEAVKATTKASEAASSASKASASAADALFYKNSAETFSNSAESWSHSASEYSAAADTSADLAKMSEDNAAKSEANAATSAANAASSEANALSYKETAVASADLSTTNKNSAADFSASASASASAAASSATAAANSAEAAKQSATDLADAVATAESLDGRLVDVEHDLSGGAKIEVVGKDKRTLGTYGGWFGSMANLGVPESNYFTECGVSQIVLWKNGTSDARNYNRLALYYYDEVEQTWILWGRSDVMSSNPGSAYPYGTRFVFNITKEASAPMLTRDTKVYFTFKYDGSTAIGSSNCNLPMFGVSLAFDTYGYGVCSGVPTAAGDANGPRNTDYCREVGYYYLDNAGVRVDAAGAPIASDGTLILHNTQRIGALEAGTGAYIIQSRDVIPNAKPTSSDVGKVLYFDHFANETTSTLAVVNRTPWAQKVCPAPIVANGAGISVIGCFDYTKNKKYIIFASGISINKISYLYELSVGAESSTLAFKSKLHTSYFSGGYGGGSPAEYCRAYCAHDGYIFYTRRHYDGGPYLAVCDVETGKAVAELDLDPKNTGGIYVNSAIWYNPLSGHICVLCYGFSLPSGETWGSNNASSHFIRVFSWDSETKTLSDIPDGDSPATVIDVTDAFAEGGVVYVGNTNAYGPTWAIRDQVFMAIQGRSYMALFHATADDRIEPCYEWDVEYETGEDGITRPVWETQPEEWTDADGNVQTIQNYVLNNLYDHVIRPKMTKGRLLKFCCAAGYDGVPSGTWSANPVFHHPTYSFCESGENQMLPEPHWYYGGHNSLIALTDGVVQWAPIAGYKFVRREAFNEWKQVVVDARADRQEFFRRADDGRWLLNDIRKGSARKFSGWLPKSGQYMSSVGATQTAQSFGNLAVLTPLTSAQSGTPLSRMGMVNNAGTDSAAMTPLPTTATYSKDWWIASMLPYCTFGFLGNVWMTTYSKTIGGVL